MNKEIAYRAIDFFVRHSSDSEKLHLGFYGGEPLLEFELIKGCVEYIKKIANKEVIFNITTNCVLLDESKIDFYIKIDLGLQLVWMIHKKYMMQIG